MTSKEIIKECALKEMLRVNILLEKGICNNISEALVYDGARDRQVRGMIEEAIQSFSRSLYILEKKVKTDRYMGVIYVPCNWISLWDLLRNLKNLTADAVKVAITRVFMVELAAEIGCEECDIPATARKMDEEDVRRIYGYLKPMFVMFNVKITEDAVVAEFADKAAAKRPWDDQMWHHHSQEEEMRRVAKQIRGLIDSGVTPEEIGVVCFTRKEKALLRKYLEEEGVPFV